MAITISKSVSADSNLEGLKQDQVIHGFKVANIYDNAMDKPMGVRFISEDHGFIIDLLQIQSVPQGFFWVKTPPESDMGEPHTCEHLLLGKGKTGRYVSALEDMSLGSSSAWTAQTVTAYHFNTVAGEKTFYDLFEAKLNALLNPDFTDEEIRREVCHIGIIEDPQDGSLELEEKGTVYTEMVSAFERPSRHLWLKAGEILYGDDHPLANSSGGYPPAIRKMVPEDLWRFHKEAYHLGNMGVIASIPEDISVVGFLKEMNEILANVKNSDVKNPDPGIGKYLFPEPGDIPEQPLTMTIDAPAENAQDPSDMMVVWPANLDLDMFDMLAMQVFMQTFTDGPTSNLYNLLINSETRAIDLGANYVWGFASSDMGNPVMIGITGVRAEHINEETLYSLRGLILDELKKVASFGTNSDELKKFNDIARGHLTQSKKQYEKFLNSPPMFGFRSSGGGWLNHLEFLEKEDGFRKSLVLKDHVARFEELLNSGENFWAGIISKANLTSTTPHALGAKPSPEKLEQMAKNKEMRLQEFVENLKRKYGTEFEQEAIKKYKEEFDRNTAALEMIAAEDELPGFIDNPPMSYDEQLVYEVIELKNGIPFVASTFENMTTSQLGLAMDMSVVPEDKMVYVPFIPTVITEIGVIMDGQVVKYDEMQNRLREEILSFGAGYDFRSERERVELVVSASGNSKDELIRAIDWIKAGLYSPYLDVENIPRMKDLIDQNLVSLRNTMKGREEYWVRYPSTGYRYQTNPLVMSTRVFLTKTHHLHRLKWLLTDPGSDADQQIIKVYLNQIAELGKNKDREALSKILENPPEAPQSEHAAKLAKEAVSSIKATLKEIPDENLSADFAYLIRQIEHDLNITPQKAIDDMKSILALVTKADNARMYMISNSRDRKAAMPNIQDMAETFDARTKSQPAEYAQVHRVVERLKDRVELNSMPVYVGLINNNTRNGVMVFSARLAGILDTSDDAVLTALSGRMYGGGGGHGLFMRTWGAGLAYSNGYSNGTRSGNAAYYAERCPDIAETMRFVVSVLKNAEPDPRLADYAVAQVFGASRAPSGYESRGASMASDLADGFYPEDEKAYRQKVLELHKQDNFYQQLADRMEDAYGPVLIGYGKSLSECKEGNYFIIGPEEQLLSLEDYIESTEGPQTVYKLYPRDFWLTI